MHPPFSVIFLTVLIGAGQGLFLALLSAQLFLSGQPNTTASSQNVYLVGSLIALGLLALGLFSSFFHLGRPERAWRSAARWKTSWLSREVIVLPATAGMIALYAAGHYFGWHKPLFSLANGTAFDTTLLIGVLAALVTFALFVCTGMIYGCIKFLQEWHSPLTVINFTLLGLASGFTLATAISAFMATPFTKYFATMAVVLTLLGAVSRIAALIRNRSLNAKSDMRSAIGVNHPVIKQVAQGSMGGSFNTREYFHGKPQTMVDNIKRAFLILAFAVPLVLLGISFSTAVFIVPALAFIAQIAGLLAERWYFFADANHPQNLYYQQIS